MLSKQLKNFSKTSSLLSKSDLRKKLKSIKLLIVDVDGVLTDGGMYYSSTGDQMKKFNVRDGMGIILLKKIGIKVAVITSESTKIMQFRAKKLKIEDLHQGSFDKIPAFNKLLTKYNLTTNQAAFIGDDLNDTSLLKIVGLAITPLDGILKNKNIAHYITAKKGGDGCVREICDLLISAQKG
ncbi:MAG: HAD-IIIA family hydrolase [Bacteroidetes bacterium]|nr:HAD-IIIA family hydrolase [Bacteroidota bacterium]